MKAKMKAKMIVTNGFRDLKIKNNFFLSCQSTVGEVHIGDKVSFNNNEIGKIINIEKNFIDGKYLYMLGVKTSNPIEFNIHDLYGKEIKISAKR